MNNNKVIFSDMPRQLKLVTEDGIKFFSREDVAEMAFESGLDVILVDPVQKIYKLADYSKLQFQKQKQTKNQKKKPQQKTLKMGVSIQEADLSRKLQDAKKFLSEGSSVVFILKMHGRERNRINYHRESIIESIKTHFESDLNSLCTFTLTSDDRNFTFTLTPVK